MAIAGQIALEDSRRAIPTTMLAAVYRGKNDVRMETVPVPAIGPGEVLIRPDAAVAYITCMPAGKIAVLDLRTWQLQPNIDLTPGIDGMAWSAK